MNLMFDYVNVYWDLKSNYDQNTINERSYLKNLFLKLERLLGPDFKKFDFYILFSHNSEIIPDSSGIEKKNKILFWFSDESGSFPEHLTGKYNLIFKSYVKKELLNVFSNPLGYVNEFEDNCDQIADQKDINVFFSGCLSDSRVRLYRALFFRKYKYSNFLKVLPYRTFKTIFKIFKINDLSKDNSVFLFSSKFKSGLGYKQYYDYILRSKFVLCPRGFESTETFRHTEALHAGCIVISEKMPDVPIYDNHPFIVYNNFDELNKILDKVANNEYDEKELIETHKTFYNSKLNVDSIAHRITEICKANIEEVG
jgi:hypothetical protein